MDPNCLSIAIQADKKFEIMNENFLYERLKLTDFSEGDIRELLTAEDTTSALLKIKREVEGNRQMQNP